MARPSRLVHHDSNSYASWTHRPLNSLVFVLPALLFFQVGTALVGNSLLAPQHLGRLLRYFGATASYLPALLIIVVLLGQHLLRRDRWTVQPSVLGGMAVESLLWIVPLIAMSLMTNRALSQSAVAGPPGSLSEQLLLAVGAGIYEEFIFRLAMISLAMLVFVDVFELRRDVVAVATLAVTAVLFSAYHLDAAQLLDWHNFPTFPFVFRMLAGLYLGTLYLLRGFGVVVGTHAAYNLFVVVVHHNSD